MQIKKVRDVNIETDILDAIFVDDHNVALITPTAEVWKVAIGRNQNQSLFFYSALV